MSDILADANRTRDLQAEVERLRAEKDEAIALMVKAQRKAGELEAENAELRGLVCQHGDGTRPEADEQDIANLKRWKQRVEGLKVTLDWFEALVQSLRKQPDAWLEEWLREYDLEHPRPGS